MRNIAGIAQTEAQKSSDMFAKCRYMDEITGSRGITFATGTPVSNSMTELYTLMRYLQYDRLMEMNLGHFDSWASTFGETVTAVELAPEGTGYRVKTRFAKFFNLPELMSVFKEAADIQTSDMLKLPVPEVDYSDVVLQPSEEQTAMVEALGKRAEIVRNGGVDASVDNMLKITNDAHDAIITKEEYENAQIAIRQMNKPKFKINNEYPLRGLIRCGVCRLSMTYLELAYEPVYYCPHKKKVGRHSDCCGDYIPAVHIDEAVWRMLRQQLNQLHDFGIQMELRKGRETKKGSLDCKQMRSEIDKLKAERIRQYEAYAEGILSREQYLVKKSALTAAVESLQGKLERLNTMIEDEDRFTGELALMKQKAGESMRLSAHCLDA